MHDLLLLLKHPLRSCDTSPIDRMRPLFVWCWAHRWPNSGQCCVWLAITLAVEAGPQAHALRQGYSQPHTSHTSHSSCDLCRSGNFSWP